ncbi:MAG: GNAT family N-acetyltransferase [Actinobacteria bacterium]|nr:GNAT family N-acetyltransferase [Actinomycetota bacterium]
MEQQPAIVRGDPDVGVVATVAGEGVGYLRLLVVDPAHRGRGLGHELLDTAERELQGCGTIQTGADPPYYLWPGVPASETAFLSLLERRKYTRGEANFHMGIDLRTIPDDVGGYEAATSAMRGELADWMDSHWVNWTPEVLRALDNGTLLVTRGDDGIRGFCAYDVNRRGLLGPVGARPDLIGQGVAWPLLVGALHRMRDDGQERMEVSWVGPVVPYARAGAIVSRVFFVYRKTLS